MMRRPFRLLLLLPAVLLPLLLVYLLFPVWAPWLIARQAAALGLERLDVRVDRPQLNGLRIRQVSVDAAGLVFELAEVDIAWSLTSLRRGRLERIDVTSGSVTIDARPTASGGMVMEPNRGINAAEGLFAMLPFAAARIESLTVSLPALDASASGSIEFAGDRLSARLAALTPERARGLVLEGALSDTGAIDLSLERAGSSEPPFLSLRSSLPGDRLNLSLEARLSDFALDLAATLAGLPAGSGLVTAAWQLNLPWPPATWQALTGGGPTQVDWQSRDGRISLRGLAGEVALAEGALEADLTGVAGATFGGTRLTLRPDHVHLVPGPLSLDVRGAVELRSADLQFEGTGAASAQSSDAGGYGLSGEVDGNLIRGEARLPLRLAGSGKLDADRVAGRLQLTSGLIRTLPVDVAYDARRQRTELRVDHRLVFSKPLLRGVWPGWQENADLDGGTIVLSMRLVNDVAGLSGTGSLDLDRVAAHAGPAAIRGLSGPLMLSLGAQGLRLDSGSLHAALVDFGVPMREVEIEVAGTPAAVSVSSAALTLLGGRASAAPFSYSLVDGAAETLVTLEDLDLAAVLALEGEHITGSGRLDGSVPIRISNGALSVAAGRIVARAPGGEIRLQPAIAKAISQPGLDLALAALINFRYTLLETAVDYSEQGDLALGVRLEGRNPEVERGRPIHFNLNVAENIPVLLRSLRLKDEFAERIERKVQR